MLMGSPFVIVKEKIELTNPCGEFYHYSGISHSYFINSIVRFHFRYVYREANVLYMPNQTWGAKLKVKKVWFRSIIPAETTSVRSLL